MKDNGNLRRTRKRGFDNVTEHCLFCTIALNKKMLKLIDGLSRVHLIKLKNIRFWNGKSLRRFSLRLFVDTLLSTRPERLKTPKTIRYMAEYRV